MGFERDPVIIASTALRHWDLLRMEPPVSKRNILYAALTSPQLQLQATRFLQELGFSYELNQLGMHGGCLGGKEVLALKVWQKAFHAMKFVHIWHFRNIQSTA